MSTLHVISGKYKDKPLKAPEGRIIRPTSGRVKESLFNILQFRITGISMLDIFAGTGQIGIEALSRGAKSVTFTDLDNTYLQENLRRCGCDKEAEVCRGEFNSVLYRLLDMHRKYDLIFADPPYASGYYRDIMQVTQRLLTEQGLLILEHDTAKPITAIKGLRVTDQRKYGSRSLTFLMEDAYEAHDISGQL